MKFAQSVMPNCTPPIGCALRKTRTSLQVLPSNERWKVRYVNKNCCYMYSMSHLEELGSIAYVCIVWKNAFNTHINIDNNPHVYVYHRNKMACLQKSHCHNQKMHVLFTFLEIFVVSCVAIVKRTWGTWSRSHRVQKKTFLPHAVKKLWIHLDDIVPVSSPRDPALVIATDVHVVSTLLLP